VQIETEYKKALETAQANYDKLGSDYTELLPLLKTHQEKIEEELNALSERSAKDTITGNVPIILAIIATACLGSFFGLRLFGAELQMEWVASGQIIQFMTVMILLSVIMALGLATILHETTLGTLLGGVAGYVLAQGGGPSSCSRCKPKGFAPSAPTASSSGAAARSPPRRRLSAGQLAGRLFSLRKAATILVDPPRDPRERTVCCSREHVAGGCRFNALTGANPLDCERVAAGGNFPVGGTKLSIVASTEPNSASHSVKNIVVRFRSTSKVHSACARWQATLSRKAGRSIRQIAIACGQRG
jgi:hypothetical protein